MGTKLISELTAASGLTGDEQMPIAQSGSTRKATLNQLAQLAPAGPPGPPGAKGPPGSPGVDGTDGQGILSGAAAPTAAIGDDGDFYLDHSTSRLYGPKTAGNWGSGTSLIGATGAQGPPGISQGQYSYRWSTTTTAADPGHGTIRGNTASAGTFTKLFVSSYTITDQAVIELTRLTTGDEVYLYEIGAITTWNLYRLTGAPVNNASEWFELPVAYVSTGPLPFAPTNNSRVDLLLPVTGEPGPPGPPGAASTVPGPTGPTGPAGSTGPAGPGVAAGGASGQILSKASAANYDTQWIAAPSGGVASVDGQTGVVSLASAYVDVTGDNMTGNLGLGSPSPTAKLQFAAGTTATGGILFGTDTNLYRSAADTLTTDDTFTSGAVIQAASSITGGFRHGSAGPRWFTGAGTPEGTAIAPVGSIYSRTDGGTDTALYKKETGAGNTGWVAVAAGGGGGGAPETGWSVATGYTVDKAFNPQDTSLNELANVLGSLIDALIRHGELAH